MKYFTHSQKSFVYKYIVMLSDVDQFKHMSFANYIKLMFLAADALFVPCLNQVFLAQNRLKVAKTLMRFHKQTEVGDSILIKITSSNLSSSCFSLFYIFSIENTDQLVASGQQDFELLSPLTLAAKELPDEIKNIVMQINSEEEVKSV